MTIRIAKPRIVAIFWAAITGLLMWVLADPQKLVQLRNAMIADSAPETSFHWIPLEKPDWFEHESTSVPAYFDAEVSRHSLRHSDPWESSMKIAKHLRSKPKVKGPIKGTTVKAYVGIVQQGRGYCADFTQVFNGLGYATDVFVREWGMSFGNFSGDGHAFNEVYLPQSRTWAFIDPLNSFYVFSQELQRPLSVLEFFGDLDADPRRLQFIGLNRDFTDSKQQMIDYYRQGTDTLFMWQSNSVFSYDEHPAMALLTYLPRSIEQLLAIIMGIHPKLLIVENARNAAKIKQLQSHFILVCTATIIWLILSLLLVRFVWMYRKRRWCANRIARY